MVASIKYPGVDLDSWAAPERLELGIAEREVAARVARALEQLGPDHREVLVLCYLEDRSVAEAAELIGIPPGTVKSRLFTARGRFQAAYGEESS